MKMPMKTSSFIRPEGTSVVKGILYKRRKKAMEARMKDMPRMPDGGPHAGMPMEDMAFLLKQMKG